jgi:hypothetical protein
MCSRTENKPVTFFGIFTIAGGPQRRRVCIGISKSTLALSAASADDQLDKAGNEFLQVFLMSI